MRSIEIWRREGHAAGPSVQSASSGLLGVERDDLVAAIDWPEG